MSFIDKTEQNVKKYNSSFKERKKPTLSLKEVTGGGVAGVTGFTGRAGMGIDDLFAGAFHPDYNEVDELLKKQIEDRLALRRKMRTTEKPAPIGGYYDRDTEDARGAYKELEFLNRAKKSFSDTFTPYVDPDWKSTGWDYDYDEFDSSMGRDRRNRMFDKDFINQSEENTERIVKEEEIELVGDNFIERAEENVKEKIEEIELKQDDFLNRSEMNLQTIYKNDIGLSISIGS